MAQFTIYRSTDGGAPVLNGVAGSLITVLDAVLVNGYGAKTAAGWTKPFSGTNKAAYRTTAAGSGIGAYLRVQDDAPATARTARITGYEAMSSVDAGTGQFPSATQGVSPFGFTCVGKSGSADATARAWKIFADDRTMYMFINPASSTYYWGWMFGEIYSFQANDIYRCMIIGRGHETDSSGGQYEGIGSLSAAINNNSYSHWLARGHTWLGGSVPVGVHGDSTKNNNSGWALGVVPFTNPEDGAIYLAPITVHDANTIPVRGLRGRMRGFWHFCHPITSGNDGDVFTGTGELAGKTFELVKETRGGDGGVSNAATFAMLETSATLETN